LAGASERKPFVLRLDPATMAALKAWAAEDLRSLNGQIEYLLRGALRDAGRLPGKTHRRQADTDADPDGSTPRATPGRQPSQAPVRVPAGSTKVTT
jgi:hypothetical protein